MDHYHSSYSSQNSIPLNGRYELSIQALCCHIIKGCVNAIVALIATDDVLNTLPSELFSFLNDSLCLIYQSIDLFLLSCDPLQNTTSDLSSTDFTFEATPTKVDLIKPWELASVFHSLMSEWSQAILQLVLNPQDEFKPISSLVSFGLATSFYLFISRTFTPDTAADILVDQAKDCLTVMLFRLPQSSPELRQLLPHQPQTCKSQLASYVKLMNPTAHQLYEASINLVDGFHALFQLQAVSLSEVVDLRDVFLSSIFAFELFQSQEIAKLFACCLTGEKIGDPLVKDCTLRFLNHANTRVRRHFHEALAQHCRECISLANCSQSKNESSSKIHFIISEREVLGELIEFGAWDSDSRTRFHAREVLVSILDCNTLIPDEKFAILCETVLQHPEQECGPYTLPLVTSLGLLIRGSDQQVATSEVCKETWALNLKLSDVALKWCAGYYDRFTRPHVLNQLCLLWHPSAEIRRDFARLVSKELHNHWSKESHKRLLSPSEDSSRHVSGSSNFSGKADWSHPDARSTPYEDPQKIFPVEPAKITKALVDSLLLNNFCHSEDSDLAPSGICDPSSIPKYLLNDLEHYTQTALSQNEPAYLREQALHSLINLFCTSYFFHSCCIRLIRAIKSLVHLTITLVRAGQIYL
ncbi:hypothetical protein Ciccas_004213 [Cichlidogyrus casuarinus]|uniref:Uncharacterized protein n=1 Tax=Cichlidogyrus casuarinus TaxID=1844966 RepID=A0ABD2QD06_9PLAT